MQARLRQLPVRTQTFACALLAASLIAPAAGFKLRPAFELFPGAVYLGLMAFPAFFGDGTAARPGPDLQLGAYGGPAYSMASPLSFTQPGGTDLRFESIPWEGQPFKPPPYYGLRGIVWPANSGQGLMLDFTHIKAESVKDVRVDQTGTRDGQQVPEQEQLSATFSKLEFTHGYNILTLNLMRRRAPTARKLVAYAGAGGALSLAAYWIVIWAMTVAPIPLVAALRETSILFALLIGMVFLGEKVTPVRGVSILAVIAGLILMRL